MDAAEIIWTGLIIVFLIVEGMTAGLTSIWFAAGALAGLITSLLNLGYGWQILAFVIVSALTVILTRPLAKKHINRKAEFTNADRVIGQTGIVTEDIDNIKRTGTVKANGKLWSARSENGEKILAGTLVTGISIVGVTLIVSAIKSKADVVH